MGKLENMLIDKCAKQCMVDPCLTIKYENNRNILIDI